ncbi:MAG TPA: hypothetical protein DD666_00650 [Advenella kashmirensis]|uniref:Uncharacterized protein n=1 Tax=Advenella kashmirensis TaxID=310575 RepID=A0A356LAX7_9BURK|nr:hypothetical protein [Advenella kashmirensis]
MSSTACDDQLTVHPDQAGAKPHKWADVIIAWANGDEIQFQGIRGGGWLDYSNTPTIVPAFYDECLRWRIKPRTIKIGDMEVPEPLRVAPEKDATYYSVALFLDEPIEMAWGYHDSETKWLSRGLLHLDRNAAIAHAKALIAVSGGKV